MEFPEWADRRLVRGGACGITEDTPRCPILASLGLLVLALLELLFPVLEDGRSVAGRGLGHALALRLGGRRRIL